MDAMIKKTMINLKKHNMNVFYFETAQEAGKKLLEMIPVSASVGVGGSMTIVDMGIPDALRKRGNTVYEHGQKGITPEEKAEATKMQHTADFFLASSNAVTAEGELMNMDGVGNRVASMAFGPGHVIFVVGKNKLVEDREAGLERIRAYAGPLNAKRLFLNTPCVKSGYCQDCNSADRICNELLITLRKPRRTEMSVIIVGEDLGY